MIPTNQITATALQTRFENLPEKLQEALESPSYIQIVEQICRSHHIVDEERALIIQQLAALVLFGFVHSYDLPHELNEQLALNNPKLAESIARGLEAKVFAPFKNELEINYKPPSEYKPQGGVATSEEMEIPVSALPVDTTEPLQLTNEDAVKVPDIERAIPIELGEKPPTSTPLEEPRPHEMIPVAFEGLKATKEFEAHREIPALGPETPGSDGAAPVFIHRESAPQIIRLENDFSAKLRAAEFSPAGEQVAETMALGESRPARLSFGDNDAAVEALFKEPSHEPPRIVDYAAPRATETVPHDLPIAPFDSRENLGALLSRNGSAKTARPPKTKTAPIDPTERALPKSPDVLELPGATTTEPVALSDIQKKTLKEISFPPAAVPASEKPLSPNVPPLPGTPVLPTTKTVLKRRGFLSRLFGKKEKSAAEDAPVGTASLDFARDKQGKPASLEVNVPVMSPSNGQDSIPLREEAIDEGDFGAILESLAPGKAEGLATPATKLENTAAPETASTSTATPPPVRTAPRVVHYNAFTTPVAEANLPKTPDIQKPPAPPASPFTF